VVGSAVGLRAADALITDDLARDTVVGASPGEAPTVRVLDGSTGAEVLSLLVYESTFTGGVFVALADFDRDGFAEIVTSPDLGGSARIRVLNGRTGEVWVDFFGIDDPAFRGGGRITTGDVNADGTPDLIVAAGQGGSARIAVYDGRSLLLGGTPAKLVADFFAFEDTLRNGAFVASSDVNGDGFADVIFGAGQMGAPRVLAISGADLIAGGSRPLVNFFAGDPASRGGVWVGTRDLNEDGVRELLAGLQSGLAPTVLSFQISADAEPVELAAQDAFEPPPLGVQVG